jgi:hypothetical protein
MLLDYINYFKHQAETHPDLLHTDSRRVFEVVDFEEAWSDFRSTIKEKDHIMRLALPSGGLSGNSDETIEVMGGFMIAKYFKTRNGTQEDVLDALASSLAIGLDIAEKICADSNNGHPLWYWSAGSPETLDLSYTPRVYAGDAAYAGYMFIFRFNNEWRNCPSSVEAPVWTDGGLTPF